METALHVIKVSTYDGFGDVQTSLFRNRMVTKIFQDDSLIPEGIVSKVKKLEDLESLRGESFVTAESLYNYDENAYSETEFTGVQVETFAFSDAHEIHSRVGKIVEDFLKAHERVVTYIPK